jgi:ABC-2 type transport system permease protein
MKRLIRIAFLETKYEFLKVLRMPGYTIPTLAFPVLFYVFFGIAFGKGKAAGDVNLSSYLLATYGAFGVIGASLFNFGVSVANERGLGWMQLKRATPMPLSAYFFAKLSMSVLFGAVIAVLLFTMGSLFGGVSFPVTTWLLLFAAIVAGAIPFSLLGLTLGYLLKPTSAPAVVNLVYLPMGFLSGLWMPIEVLPKIVRNLANFLPAFHLGQVTLGVIGVARGTMESHLTALAGFTLIFLATAIAAYRLDQVKNYA